MKYRIVISLIVLPFLLLCETRGQEIVRGLQSIREINELAGKQTELKTKGINDTLDLPFFDDFSLSLIYPADTLWADNEVYINNTHALEQLSLGVATFDALNSSGYIYDHASTISFEADHLTSNPIDLEGGPADNFYLSFFYQPQGLVDPPELKDFLTLQFYSVVDDSWYSVWSVEGSETHPFKPVIIAIDDPKFTSKGFRFKFTNHASLSSSASDPGSIGNADQWHIDYVHLDRGRHSADTVLRDVAFTQPLRSLLQNYEAMPWEQFKSWSLSEMGDALNVFIINNDSIERNVSRAVVINDIYEGGTVYAPTPAAKNIAPGLRTDFDSPIIYTYNSASVDSALFEVEVSLITDIFDNKVNDTIRYQQLFSNYYSVDDGSSEAGYGVNGGNDNNAIAVYRYKSLSQDTIRAIDICFNDSYQNANHISFDLVVLESINQSPGDIIYSQEEEMVNPGSSINGFVTYRLNDPVPVNGDFFVGWRQRSTTFINAGLDLNTPPEGRQYYMIYGEWYLSQVEGSLMIRPIVGKPLLSTNNETLIDENRRVNIWPNPVKDLLYIQDNKLYPGLDARINIFSTSGRLVRKGKYSETINLSQLSEGAYFLVIMKGDHVYSRNKFIKTR
jgi:hypothetical protein